MFDIQDDVVFKFSEEMYKLPASKGINKDTREEVLGLFYGGMDIEKLSAFIPEEDSSPISTSSTWESAQGSSSRAPIEETAKKNALGAIIQQHEFVSKPIYIENGQSYTDFYQSSNYPDFKKQAERLFTKLSEWNQQNLPKI